MVGGPWNAENASDDSGGLYNGAEDGVIGAAECDGFMFDAILLFSERDADEVSQVKVGEDGGDILFVLEKVDVGHL